VASVASLVVLFASIASAVPAGASSLPGVPRVVSLGAVTPTTLHPGDVVHASPTIEGADSSVMVLLVDEYGGTHALQGRSGADALGVVADWWPAGHYELGAIQVTTGTLLGADAGCFYCYAYYDLVGDQVLEGAYDDGFTSWRSTVTAGLPFDRSEIDSAGADVVNPGGDVTIADLDSAAITGGTDGAFPAGAAPRLTIGWGVDALHPYQSGSVSIAGVHRGVIDANDVHTWYFDVSPAARTAAIDLAGLPNGRYRVSSITLLTDDGYQLQASLSGSSTYPPRIGGGAVHADLSALKLSVGVPPDVTPPVLSVPGSVTTEAVSAAGSTVTYDAAADDAIDGPVSPACAPPSGSTFALGSTTVTCVATDDAGNVATAAFDVTVVDTTPPTIALHGNAGTYDVDGTIAISCTATDLVSTPTCEPASFSSASASFTAGPHVVSFRAADAAGNRATAIATFDVSPTIAGMINLTDARVTKDQLASALDAKLRSGNLQAYRQQLRAQVGKGITSADADVLTAYTYALPS
jgi:hypothetical protein